MRFFFCLSFLTLCCAQPLFAQLGFRVGGLFYLDYNLYQWYQRPQTASGLHQPVGQPLNVLPGVGGGGWIGNPEHWLLVAEGRAEFFPYSFNIKRSRGFGALSLCALSRLVFPLSGRHAICPYLAMGGGVQWSKTELYNKPSRTPFFVTYVLELDMGLGSGWGKGQNDTRFMGFFFRAGAGAEYCFTFNLGLRIGGFKGTRSVERRRQPKPQDPVYHTSVSGISNCCISYKSR